MRQYAMHHYETNAVKLETDPDFDGDWHARYGATSAYSIDGEVCGIPYNEELASIDGMRFYLFPPAGTTDETIESAKAKLRSDRDVVGLRVFRSTN